jgi:GxxExxY protein
MTEIRSLKLASPLSVEDEVALGTVLGSAVHVHRTLGPGLLERFYRQALCMELDARGVSFDTERAVPVRYMDRVLGVHRPDLLIEQRVVVELKAVQRFEIVHTAQVLSYLRAANLRAGLLLNFNAAPLGIRRIVL